MKWFCRHNQYFNLKKIIYKNHLSLLTSPSSFPGMNELPYRSLNTTFPMSFGGRRRQNCRKSKLSNKPDTPVSPPGNRMRVLSDWTLCAAVSSGSCSFLLTFYFFQWFCCLKPGMWNQQSRSASLAAGFIHFHSAGRLKREFIH